MFYPEKLVEKYSTDEKFLKLVQEGLKKAEEGLNIAEISNDEAAASSSKYASQHKNYASATGPFLEYMPYLCFAYRYTGDKRFADKAKKLMLLYSSFDKWHGDCYGKSELNTAHFCLGMTFGYTTITDYLSYDDKITIAKATFEKGISNIANDWVLPGTRINALDTMGHNWWCVCVASALCAAISMQKEIGINDNYIEALRDALVQWFKYQGNPINAKPTNYCDGGFYEGLHYLSYSLREYALCNFIYKNIKGESIFDDEEYMKNYMLFFSNTIIPSTANPSNVNFGDNRDKFAFSILYLLGNGIECPEAVWYIKQWKTRDFSFADILFYDKIHCADEKIPESTSICYYDMGWAVMRKSFEENSPVLAVKCGDSWNHAHLDAGHFTFSNYGNDIIYDSGTCEYVHAEYVDYYCSSLAHNVVLFNGNGQDSRDRVCHTRMTGKLYNMTETESVKYIAADVTGPMGRYFRRHIRHFLWLDDFILIYDDIEAHEAGDVNFLMHIEEKYSSEFIMLTEATRSKNIGKKDGQPEKNVLYDCYTIPTDCDGRVKIVSIIKLKPEIAPSLIQEGDFLVVSTENTTVYINILSDGRIMHQNCIAQINGYITDAVMFAEMNENYFIVNGSMLRQEEKSIYDNLYRENIEIIK